MDICAELTDCPIAEAHLVPQSVNPAADTGFIVCKEHLGKARILKKRGVVELSPVAAALNVIFNGRIEGMC